MHKTVQNLLDIENQVKSHLSDSNILTLPKIIAVSKTFKMDKILPLIEHGHLHFGENKVQESVDKWSEIKNTKPEIKLHMIGKLQKNKVKFAVKLFDYIHSVDSDKLAEKIATEQQKIQRNIKIFIQVNLGNEEQKSGINKNEVNQLIEHCKKLNLNVIGFMCIPPFNEDPDIYFKGMRELKNKFKLNHLSMGMSSDYLKAIDFQSTYLRIGSNIFGART